MTSAASSRTIQVVDSHTEGEPTRIIVAGGPDLGDGDLDARRERFCRNFDEWRSAVIDEPRGSEVLVGGILCEPSAPDCAAGVIFFNNAGYLNMCGHGAIGTIVTLHHLGRIVPGSHRLDTPVGPVTATLHDPNRVTIRNVRSYRYRKNVAVDVPGYGRVVGDVAWGGNWFYLVHEHQEELRPDNVKRLTDVALRIRAALESNQITGADGGVIDHLELFGPPVSSDCDSRNFVLCPGGAYDRSPCGTGTSAKLACLVADGKFKPGDVWRQESIIGSRFEGAVEIDGDGVIPSITGCAYVNAEATLLLQPHDPFCMGIRP